MRKLLVTCLFIICPVMLWAQADEDKGRITRYLEETLSGLGRDVRIDGFQGALSSRVTMDRMTIADADGVWLTLTDAVLDWNRAAILSGRINIDQISAAKIDLARLPVSEDETSPEASGGFSLPELPVSIDIKAISAKEVILGAPLLGETITLSLDGALTLEGGEGQATLDITRLSGPRGVFRLAGRYANVSRQLMLDLTLDEAEEGIVATLLNLPGKPALVLNVKGDAPIDAFAAEVDLKSDGQTRLTGEISTSREPDSEAPVPEGDGDAPRIISVDISGDLAPLFAPQYQPFFGPDVSLQSLVRMHPDGRIALDKLNLAAAALRLHGNMLIAADGLPERFNLQGQLESADQTLVTLPVPGADTRVKRAKVSAEFNAAFGDEWEIDAELSGLKRPDLDLEHVSLSASGTIKAGETPAVTARVDSRVRGLVLLDDALSEAVGDAFQLSTTLHWRVGQPFDLREFLLRGDGMKVSGSGIVSGTNDDAVFKGGFEAEIESIERFSGVAGRPLAGGVTAELSGEAEMLSGAFDLELTASATDLAIGIEQADSVLRGTSNLIVSGKRDQNGLILRKAEVTTQAANARVIGFVSSEQTNFEFSAALDDLRRFVSSVAGPVELSGEATQHDTGWLIDLEGTGPFESSAKGRLAVPDDGEPSVNLTGEIGNVGAILPDLAGSATFVATARQQGDSWAIDTSGQGPGGSTFAVAGSVMSDASRGALKIDGTLPLALANRRLRPRAAQGMGKFDLRLDGPFSISSVSGDLSTSGARITLPELQNSLTNIDANVTLRGENAVIRSSAELATGGRLGVKGQVGTAAPYRADLEIEIRDAVIRDPELFETTALGNLTLNGRAPDNLRIAGRINLDRTEIRVPSGNLAAGNIPEIKHVNEPAAVNRTRRFAGLVTEGTENESSGGIAIGLDVLIAADNRIFVRGRGLDAELGGRFRVTGTTAEIIPIGGFDLIRGRLDILGKRLTLDEGSARLQGDFIPGLRLVASTVSEDDTVVRIVVEGRADNPEVSFESEPQLPEDEILARLLFGRDVRSLSAFQALQLASAVARLSGKGGVGLAERIRQTTGVDDFNVVTEDGETKVGVGKYISDKIYTDVQVGRESTTDINLNIDLSRRTKVRGQLSSDGSTGVGIFFEKDY